MTPFKELQDLADKIRDKTGESCFISVGYWAYKDRGSLAYTLYQADPGNKIYDTVKDIKDAMNELINASVDDGVSLKEG